MKSFETLVGKTTRAAIANDRQIKQMISKIVPANTMAHIEFCRIEGGRMRITVDSAAWISRIRFLERQIIDCLRERKFDTHTISYHVSPEIRPAVHKPTPLTNRTKSGAAAVEAAAAVVTDASAAEGSDDSDRLRQELLKLARTLRSE